jgi:hypothetical protein
MNIQIKMYPQLTFIAWQRNPNAFIDEEAAFRIYESNWRHVDKAALTQREVVFIERLTRDYGHGVFLHA